MVSSRYEWKRNLPFWWGMRSGFRSSISGLNCGVAVLSVLAKSRVSDPADGAPSCVKKRSASTEWDRSKEPPLAWPPCKRIRNATTRITANRNKADRAPVMMATRGLMAIPLEDGSGRGGSTAQNIVAKLIFYSRHYGRQSLSFDLLCTIASYSALSGG